MSFNSLASALAPVLPFVNKNNPQSEILSAGYAETQVIDRGGNPRTVSSLLLPKRMSEEAKMLAIGDFETSSEHAVSILAMESVSGPVSYRIRIGDGLWIGYFAYALRWAEAKARGMKLTDEQRKFRYLSITGRVFILPQWFVSVCEIRAAAREGSTLMSFNVIRDTLVDSLKRFLPKGQSPMTSVTHEPVAKKAPVAQEISTTTPNTLTTPAVVETGETHRMRFAWRETKKRNPMTGEDVVKRYMQASHFDNLYGMIVYQVPEGEQPFPQSGETWEFTVGQVQFFRPANPEKKKAAMTVYVAELVILIPWEPKGKTAEDFQPDGSIMLVGHPGGNGDGQKAGSKRLPASVRKAAAEAKKDKSKLPKGDKDVDRKAAKRVAQAAARAHNKK